MPVSKESGRIGKLILATKNGKIKKTEMTEFESIRKNGKIAISLDEGDELIGAVLTEGDNEVLMAASKGKCIRFHESAIRSMGRTAGGVKSMKLDDDDYIVDICVVKDDMDVLTITQNGYGKRTDISEYRVQGRAGKGIKAGTFTEKTGRIVSLKLIKAEETDVMLITASGMIIRSHADEISKIGRNGQGVRIMKLRETAGNRVVAVTIAPRYEEPAEEIKDEPEESAIVTAETVETPVTEVESVVESEEAITDTVTDGDAE